jgi:hypothetical protein
MKILIIILPILTGAAGIWVGYYLKWDVEKKKMRYQERKILLSSIREIIIKSGGNHPEYFNYEFSNSIEYSRIKSYLSKELVQKIEYKNTF